MTYAQHQNLPLHSHGDLIMKFQKGYILFIVLIFLQIFSLLGLFGLNSSLLVLKANSEVWERDKLFLHAQSILHVLEERALIHGPSCLVPLMPANLIAKKSLAWWQQHACHGMNYYYVTEPLGINPCAIVAENSNGTQYYRITLMDLS